MANRDQLNEVYYGRKYSPETQQALRDRIHWMCKQARGPMILDVGCSQGIASILLAREGAHVLGVDVDPEAIEYAEAEKKKEPPEVQKRLTFLCMDAADLKSVGPFSTVLMGQVLEHLINPHRLLTKVWELLEPEGRMVVTVPYGWLDHFDHKHTFYTPSFLQMVLPYTEPLELTIIGNRLCYVGIRRGEIRQDIKFLPAELARVGETHLEQLQRQWSEERRRLNNELKARHEELKNERMASREKIEIELNARRQELEQLKQELDQAKEEKSKLLTWANEVRALWAQTNRLIVTREQQWRKACLERDRVISSLHRRVAALEQSTKFRLGSLLVDAARRPLTLPVVFLKGLKLTTEAVRRKVRGEKRQLRLAPLPVLPAIPRPLQLPRLPELRVAHLRSGAVEFDVGLTALPSVATLAWPGQGVPAQIEVPAVSLPSVKPARPWLKVAAIMDEFSQMAFQYEFQYIAFGPEDWKETLERERPNLLLVESAWVGNNGRWHGYIAGPNGPKAPFVELVQWCKKNGIPTVFWNKEDPPHFDRFIKAATLFDRVYTVDANCIPKYREILGHDRVGVLPFAAQPRIHNPTTVPGGRVYDVAFAGGYYAHHPERAEQMKVILDPALEFNVHIFDRHYGTQMENLRWPEQYERHIVGSLSYQEMLAAYKMYKVFLNVNSVIDSPTMCARRVFELLACGTTVLSGYSPAIENLFGTEVELCRTPEETTRKLRMLLGNAELRDRRAVVGLRKVLESHTYSHRVDQILSDLGLYRPQPKPLVSAIVATMRPAFLQNVFANIARQVYQPLELVLVLHGVEANHEELKETARAAGITRLTVIKVPADRTLGYCMNAGVEAAEGQFLAKMDDDDFYGPHYISDLINAFQYTEADVVGKLSCYMYLEGTGAMVLRYPGQEYKYVNWVTGATMTWKREVSDQVRFPDRSKGEDTVFLQTVLKQGGKIYSTDRFNYVCIRRAENDGHTWRVSDEELLAKGQIQFYGRNFEHVVV